MAGEEGLARSSRGAVLSDCDSARNRVTPEVAKQSSMINARAGVGITVWFFLRPRPGQIQLVFRSTVEAFFRRQRSLPTCEAGFVDQAQIIVRLQDRRAVEVLRIGYYRYPVRENGMLDQRRFSDFMQLAGEAAFGGVLGGDRPKGIVAAEHRFAKRRLEHTGQWKPAPSEISALVLLVNRKAGSEIM